MDLRTPHGRRELGQRIQTAVAAAGYPSLSAFARVLGCSRALIYQYVNGDVLVQLDRLSRIAELTDRPLDWFLVSDVNGCAGQVRRLEERLAEALERCRRLEAALAAERGARLEEAEQARRAQLEGLRQLCAALRRAGDASGLLQAATRCADLAQAVGDAEALRASWLAAGHAAWHLGDREAAEQALTLALHDALETGDTRAELSARQELLRVHQASGRVAEAREQAEALAASDRWWPRWSGRVSLAALAEMAGDLSAAEEELDRAEQVIAEPEAPRDQALVARVYVQSNRANLALARGRYADAGRESELLADLAAEAGVRDQVREATLNRALAAMRTGRLRVAQELLERLREWARIAGDRRLEALSVAFDAERLVRAGDARAARKVALKAIDLADSGLNGQALAEAELAGGLAALAAGDADSAAWHLQHAADRAGRLSLRRLEVAASVLLARAQLHLGRSDAIANTRKAMEQARDHGYEDLALEAALTLRAVRPQDDSAPAMPADLSPEQYQPLPASAGAGGMQERGSQ